MNGESEPKKYSVSTLGWLSMAFLAVAYSWIGLAYASQLNAPPQPSISNQMMMQDQTKPNFTAPDGTILSRRFMPELVGAAGADRGKLLWGMYPASIRGRVFTGSIEIASPLSSAGGGW